MNNTIQVKIRNVAVGGDSVGEVYAGEDPLLGITAFIPFGAPGDDLECSISEKKDRFIRGKIEKINFASKDRVTPRCSHFTICGGCDFQHISYQTQLSLKYDMVVGALRAAQIPSPILEMVDRTIPSDPYGYRRRVILHVDSRGKVGFYAGKSRSVVPLQECPIATPELEEYIVKCNSLGPRLAGKVNAIHLESDASDIIALLVSPYELNSQEVRDIAKSIKDILPNFVLRSGGQEVLRSGKTSLKLPLSSGNSSHISLPVGSFSQVNWDINLALIETIQDFGEDCRAKRVLDLYAGAGNLSLPFAIKKTAVRAVETDANLVSLATKNAESLKAQEFYSIIESSVEKFLKGKPKPLEQELLIADPPRSGIGSLYNSLTPWENIALVSCSIPSFTRDLKHFIEQGYQVRKIKLFDMFPQTNHLEIATLLSK